MPDAVTAEMVNAGLVLQEANKDGSCVAYIDGCMNPALFRYQDRTTMARQWADRTIDIDVATKAGAVYHGRYCIDANNYTVGSTINELTIRELIKINKGSRLHQIYIIPDGDSLRFVIGRREGEPARFVYVAFDLRLTPQSGAEQILGLARFAAEDRCRTLRALTEKAGGRGFLYPRHCKAPKIPTVLPFLAIEAAAPMPDYKESDGVSARRSGDYKIVFSSVRDTARFDIVSETLEWGATVSVPERALGMPIRKLIKRYFQPTSYVRVCRLNDRMALIGGKGVAGPPKVHQLCASVDWIVPLTVVTSPLFKAYVGSIWADVHMRTMASCIDVEFKN